LEQIQMTKRAILDIGACLRPDSSQTTFNLISAVGGGKSILNKSLKIKAIEHYK
jgi:hypothetical protein